MVKMEGWSSGLVELGSCTCCRRRQRKEVAENGEVVLHGNDSPHISTDLRQWEEDGSYFVWQGRRIFYRDSCPGDIYNLKEICLLIHGFPS